jgi:outer membrane protein TolC
MRHTTILLLLCALPIHAQENPPQADAVPTQEATDATLEVPAIPALLDLATAQQIALAQNPSLTAAAARIEQAKARVRQARSLYFPQIEASYAASRTELSDATLDGIRDPLRASILQSAASAGIGLITGAPTNMLIGSAFNLLGTLRALDAIEDHAESYRADLTASYLIFDGFSRRFTNAAARFGKEEIEAAYAETQRLLLDAVAQAYYGVQLARENIAIARTDEDFNARLLKDAQARRRVGAGSLSDELNFEVRQRAAAFARIAAERDYAIARIALAALLGFPDAALPENTEFAPLDQEHEEELAPPDEETLLASALNYRPDLTRARAGQDRAQATIGQRRAAYYPRVSAFASENASRSANSAFDSDDLATTVGLGISYTLSAGGRNKAAVAEAKAAKHEADALAATVELDIAREVRQAAEEVRTAQEQVLLQREAESYVRRNRDLVEKEFNAGQAPLVRLNEAQRDLVEAQSRLAQARVALRLRWHALRTATAETLHHLTPVQ